jgi:predicted AAA+ superfamily ATPase
MTGRENNLITRDSIDLVRNLLDCFPCVVIIGARQVGKSTFLRQLLPCASTYDLEDYDDFQLINENPEFFLSQVTTPVIIDEAQLSPNLFKALRVAIDKDRKTNGKFLLSGSSSPHLLKNISESLAGRVAIVELAGLSWSEALEKEESDFIENIFCINHLQKLKTNKTRKELLELCLYGSYPEPYLNRRDTVRYYKWQENYIKTYIERDIRSLFPRLNLEAYRRLISMLAFSTGEIINLTKLSSSLGVSASTVSQYLEIIEGTFLWRKLKPYETNLKKRLIKSAKGYLRDTGLINYFLKIQTLDQLQGHPNYGHIWEIFVIEQIFKSLANKSNYLYDVYFYRTKHKAEIDLVIETSNGLIPIEIKSSMELKTDSTKSIKSFIEEYQCPHGIIISNSEKIQMRSERVIEIPAIYL